MKRKKELEEFISKNFFTIDVVIMKGSEIPQYHFEDEIACRIGMKYIGKEEKQRIVDSYKK